MNPQHIIVTDGFTLNPVDNPWSDIDQLGALTVYDHRAGGAYPALPGSGGLDRQQDTGPPFPFCRIPASNRSGADLRSRFAAPLRTHA